MAYFVILKKSRRSWLSPEDYHKKEITQKEYRILLKFARNHTSKKSDHTIRFWVINGPELADRQSLSYEVTEKAFNQMLNTLEPSDKSEV